MVRKWRKQQDDLRQVKKTKQSFRGNKARWLQLEDKLEQWVVEQRAASRSVSTITIRMKATALASELNIGEFKGGASWCFRFMKRRNLSIRTRTTVSQQLPEDYQEELATFRACCKNINMDEVPLTFDIPVNRTEDKTGARTSLHSPSTPTTLSLFQGGGEKAGSTPLSSSIISQAACSPSSSSSSSSDLPVISDVFSLSVTPQRRKRSQPVTPQTTLKRPRVNGFHSSTPTTPSSVDVRPLSPKSVPHFSDDDGDTKVDTNDDNIVILETASAPKPKKPVVHLNQVKKEEESSQIPISMECGNDAAVDATSEIKVEGTSSAESAAVESCPSPSLLEGQASATTQKEIRLVKQEVDSQNQTEREEGAPQSTSACSAEQKLIKQESSENTGEWVLQNMMRDHSQSEVSVRKEFAHQGSQTEETEEKIDYKSLFEKTKKKVNELIKDIEALFEATEMKPNSEEEDSDEISMMFGRLLHELDERNQERDELRSQLNSLEDRNANLEAKCELLKLILQHQQKENSGEGNESMRG
ncbi:uncharacterized protein LOC125017634 isoform X2 [Mugil cephalus]|uniref:uncharacterized protein LOC125017634 isoform X2 n=1 Tax=Mugil cephalus TaxID=48193 RepID=UPI001FB74187|nr:uncharacterized protein LOC125017634 isoform X2 [Mugil cephalus]